MKRCWKCKTEKPVSDFGKKATTQDGLQPICKACQKVERKAYYEAHKGKEFANHTKYAIAHRGEINACRARWRANDPAYYKRTHQANKKRAEQDLDYLITQRVRYRIARALDAQHAQASKQILELLGCSIEDYRPYLETTFTEGMTWERYRKGEMQIDHHVPCACFDLSKPAHQLACFNFRNTRMLWAAENSGKKKNHFLKPDEVEAYVQGNAS